MKKTRVLFLVLIVLVGVVGCKKAKPEQAETIESTAEQGEVEMSEVVIPSDWSSKEQNVWIENGIVYAKGSAKMASFSLSRTTATTRARTNLCRAFASGEIDGFPSIPNNVQERSTITYNDMPIEFGALATVDESDADDGTWYVLMACRGAESK